MKAEFLCVKPKSSKAKNRFANLMDQLHSCRVEQRKDGRIFLASISGRYHFWVNESADDHWDIIKQSHGEVTMLLLSLLLATHVPQEQYLRCDDYEWLKEGIQSSTLFTPVEKFSIITKWIHHTDPKCFEDKE